MKLGHVGLKSRSLDQILKKPFLHAKGFIPFFTRFQNLYLCDWLVGCLGFNGPLMVGWLVVWGLTAL